MGQEKITKAIADHGALIEQAFGEQSSELERIAEALVETFHQGGRLLVFGHGSLGAVANLVANLFLHRLTLDRPLLPALSLSHDATLAGALHRDGQSSQLFVRPLRAVAAQGDVVLALGGPGRNEALEEALAAARQLGCKTAVVLWGKGETNSLSPDFLFCLKTDSAPRGVEGTLTFGHLLCELVESDLFGI
ncbi:MAG: hypothetical protein C0617_04040 [Desulfuromonas sp.]|uniref:SIS domain-containing protein n=1 Tax=Desulfuromonas sp. TaxID=892 RepID=UPI000CC13E74|nr:SIS domain-containing protein [Desulfuromonas sp.]PLX85473.1 MAG: hypothetical protein C0617_04040 [Desulfuromonas sp.]